MSIRISGYYLILLVILFISLKSFSQTNREEISQLGNKREIFVDQYLIDELDGTSIVMHRPHDEGIVMYFNNPWEGMFSAYSTVIKDENIYRLYYRGVALAGKDGSNNENTCYAESKDGIHWEKPNLGLYEINGTFNNNVVLANDAPQTHNFSPFIDKNPNTKKNQKYKALGGIDTNGLIAYTSADGIHWKRLKKEAVLTDGIFDSQNCAFWSEREKCYVCYFRTWTDDKGLRTISRATSQDFINWSETELMTFGDTLSENLYTNQTSPYFRASHIYVAIGARFMPERQILSEEQLEMLKVDPSQRKGISDAYFMTTRGGNIYERTFMESFIRPATGGNNWMARTNYPALNVVQTSPEEMSIYLNQDYAQPTAHLHRYSLRLDGFTSISAPYSGGEVITKPFTFTGNEFEINYSTSVAGEIKFELQDENGDPIHGFTLQDSETIIGNEISKIVSWNGIKDLQNLVSKTVRLRIYMKDADLYSIRFK